MAILIIRLTLNNFFEIAVPLQILQIAPLVQLLADLLRQDIIIPELALVIQSGVKVADTIINNPIYFFFIDYKVPIGLFQQTVYI